MSNTEPENPNLARINAEIHAAFTAALNDEHSLISAASTPTTSSNGTDLPGPQCVPDRDHRDHVHRAEVKAGVKATHVEVDAEAWRFLRAQAIRWRRPLSEVLGELVRSAVTGGVPVEAANEKVARRRTRGRRATAFTRLYGIDDATWTAFKAEAALEGVTVARAVGILAEFVTAEVRARIPSPDPSREYPARSRDPRAFGGRGR